MFETKLEKLEDALLENISGGSSPVSQADIDAAIAAINGQIDTFTSDQPKAEDFADKAADLEQSAQGFRRAGAPGSPSNPSYGLIALTAVGAGGALACSAASAICKAVSVRAKRQGNIAKSARCQKAAIGLGACVAPFAGLAVVGGIGLAR